MFDALIDLGWSGTPCSLVAVLASRFFLAPFRGGLLVDGNHAGGRGGGGGLQFPETSGLFKDQEGGEFRFFLDKPTNGRFIWQMG